MSKAVIFQVGGHDMAFNPEHVERVQYRNPYPGKVPQSDIVMAARGDVYPVAGSVRDVAAMLWPEAAK